MWSKHARSGGRLTKGPLAHNSNISSPAWPSINVYVISGSGPMPTLQNELCAETSIKAAISTTTEVDTVLLTITLHRIPQLVAIPRKDNRGRSRKERGSCRSQHSKEEEGCVAGPHPLICPFNHTIPSASTSRLPKSCVFF